MKSGEAPILLGLAFLLLVFRGRSRARIWALDLGPSALWGQASRSSRDLAGGSGLGRPCRVGVAGPRSWVPMWVQGPRVDPGAGRVVMPAAPFPPPPSGRAGTTSPPARIAPGAE